MLVHIELVEGRALQASLEALGAGRRIASDLGATLCAHAAVPGTEPNARLAAADLAEQVGAHGADKVIVSNGSPDPVATWETDGAGLCRAADDLQPNITLLSATSLGRDLGPRLAAHLGAAYLAEPSLEDGAQGKLVFSRELFARSYRRRLSGDGLGSRLVATLTPGSSAVGHGLDDADLIFDSSQSEPPRSISFRSSRPIPLADLASKRVLVCIGGGISKDLLPLAVGLAAALDAELVGTALARRRGLIEPEREIGIDARHVAPSVYFCLGASGSAAHLGAIARRTEIVAIDRDKEAQIFRAASYGVVGELAEVLPVLIETMATMTSAGTQ